MKLSSGVVVLLDPNALTVQVINPNHSSLIQSSSVEAVLMFHLLEAQQPPVVTVQGPAIKVTGDGPAT